ncbi:CotH kinase family protein [Flavobacteriaceae bacterium]|nr:CotH kinase family protein [Flavobacteriaceae bacterium]
MNFKSILIVLFLVGCSGIEELSDKREESFVDESSINPLPFISINTGGNLIVDDPKVSATLNIKQGDSLIEAHQIGIEIRGSSSQMFDKKSYGFETWDENDDDLDAPLGGFPEEEDWILYGPYSDKSLIRNVLIYGLSNDIGQYATRTNLYELEINESFLGTYVLMEKIKRDKNRVDVSKNKEEDVSGGYILKIDKPTGDGQWYDDSFSFSSKFMPNGNIGQNKNTFFLYEYPNADDINDDQKNYIQNFIHDFENALASENFSSEQSGYQNYIDLDSFIDFFILNEVSKNPDGFRLSTFMHKDKGEKLKMGPIWDFNLAFGNVNYCNGASTEGWTHRFNEVCPNDTWLVPFWWNRFMEDPVFVSTLKERWNNLRTNLFSTSEVLQRITLIEEQLKSSNAIKNNFSKWSILGEYVWPNDYIGNSYDDEINYLKDWTVKRLEWMDIEINNL